MPRRNSRRTTGMGHGISLSVRGPQAWLQRYLERHGGEARLNIIEKDAIEVVSHGGSCQFWRIRGAAV
jgi:hypothetical protein